MRYLLSCVSIARCILLLGAGERPCNKLNVEGGETKEVANKRATSEHCPSGRIITQWHTATQTKLAKFVDWVRAGPP